MALQGTAFGFDFNPHGGPASAWRLTAARTFACTPDTGAVVDADPAQAGVQTDGGLAYAPGDASAGRSPRVVGAAYSYNKVDPKITTNFAIDAAAQALVTQGSREGTQTGVVAQQRAAVHGGRARRWRFR